MRRLGHTLGIVSTLTVLGVTSLAAVAQGGEISGTLLNGTTNETGQAEIVRLMDMAGGMDTLGVLEGVDGQFTFPDVPFRQGPPYILQIQSAGVLYNHSVLMTQETEQVEVTVYDATEDLAPVVISMAHAIFTRNAEHLSVMQLMEFENQSDPPRSIWQDQGPIRVEVPGDIHGDVEVTVRAASSTMPLQQELLETDEEGVFTIPYPFKPGNTRVVLRYELEYDGQPLAWAPRMFFPVARRSALVSPEDIVVSGADLIAHEDENAPAGYAVYLGGALLPGDAFAVNLMGGSAGAADPHAGLDMSEAQSRVEIRANRLNDKRLFLMLALGGVLVGAVLVAGRPSMSDAQDKSNLSDLEDNYVAGRIDRAAFERQRKGLGPRTRTSESSKA